MTGAHGRGLGERLAALGAATLSASAMVTLLVRALGLGGQGLMSSVYGAGAKLDGYFIALILPGLLITPVATAIELSLTGSYARLLVAAPERAADFRRRSLRAGVALGGAVAVLATAAAPLLVVLTSPGADEQRHHLALVVALFVYPAMAAQLVSAVAGALHYGEGRYQKPLLIAGVNPLAIVGALVLWPGGSLVVLGGAVLVGYVLEAVLLVMSLGSSPHHGSESAATDFNGARRDVRPLLLSLSLGRAVPIVDQIFVSGLKVGTLATFAIATRMFDVVLNAVALPNSRMATVRLASSPETRPKRAAVRRECGQAMVVGLIGALGFASAAPVLIMLVYRHGRFTNAAAVQTIHLAEGFALATVPATLAFLLPRILLAFGRSRLLVRFTVLEAAANLVLDALLIAALGALGIVLATVLTYTFVAGSELAVVRFELRRPAAAHTLVHIGRHGHE